MAQNFNGLPKVQAEVVDKSILLVNPDTNIYCVQGITQRGQIGKAVFVRNQSEFLREFGYRVDSPNDHFALDCIRILNGGGKLWVSPVGHFSDITDRDTIEGAYATSFVKDDGAVGTVATSACVVTTAGADGDSHSIASDEGDGAITLGAYIKETSDTEASIAQSIVDSINDGFTTHGYTAAVTTGPNFVLNAPVGSGSAANSYTVAYAVTGTAAGTASAFTEGVDTIAKGMFVAAKEKGEGYNGTEISVLDPVSGLDDVFDISVLATGAEDAQFIRNVAKNPTQQDLDEINERLRDITIISIINELSSESSGLLSGGGRDLSLLVAQDFIGSSQTQTGWYSFNEVTDAFRIANISKPEASVDDALMNYVLNVRKSDMRYHLATPQNLQPSAARDYRNKTGAYSGTTKQNTWVGSLIAAEIKALDVDDSTKTRLVSGVVDFLVQSSRKDSKPWLSAGGPKRGVNVSPNIGVNINYAGAGLIDAANQAYDDGVNPWISDAQFGITFWGNKSLLVDRSKMLNADNVADLAMYINKYLPPLTRTELFEPNDPETWRQIYLNVLPFIKNLADNRAIRPKENEDWFWIGDQFVDSASEAQFNKAEDIDRGIYRARFVFVPIRSIEYIGLDIVVTDSGTTAQIVTDL